MILSGWGRYPKADCRVVEARRRAEVLQAIGSAEDLIARGNGRSYGDAALNPNMTLSLRRSSRLIAFDPDTGSLTCEAGVMLADIIDLFLPRGWFPPVTPGTKYVTIGGMIAADVHGKNHHGAGSFGSHVDSLELALADGTTRRCSRTENAELFAATCGGMGLTGIILQARFRLLPVETSLIRQETIRARNLEEVMAAFEDSQSWTYTVAWIDCLAAGGSLGRSLLYRGEHALASELPAARRGTPFGRVTRPTRSVPIDFPSFVLNRWSVTAFNELYYRRGREGTQFIDFDPYFYPLDAILEWNRIYGGKGFVQYQCVLPKAASPTGIAALLQRIAEAGNGSFLSVLKLFGQQEGVLSFPMEGYTLALDFPANHRTFSLLAELDAIVADHGGRIYLAKDARTSPAMIRRGYPNLPQFDAVRSEIGAAGKFSSLQSRRLAL